jgi:acetyl-CoA carboxylase, biotin carboxylase subunit
VLQKVLIANRGEIAVRVIRACRELGIRCVAVYSDADRLAPHVLEADEAHAIGPAPAAESYLRAESLVELALRSECDAVHPGYGFLAERAYFAEAVEAAGLAFVGPSAESIRAMGDKTEARRRMLAAGVPVVPGNTEAVADAGEAAVVAAQLGYPVLLKAAAGGGGKGMRVVATESELTRALEAARHEAQAAFGEGSVYVEKYLDRPRHIEIQVLGDRHGRVLHLGERECSVQRRHQKMIEEAPSPAVDPHLRARIGEAAVAAAAAVDYHNAGTIEFLVQDDEFYFLEMNTRIQVEHPVTELITGIDLVQWQLRIAAGEALSFTQTDVTWTGHALECRITSEDPLNGFLPSTGRITTLDVPAGPGVRWDAGIATGSDVSLFYDPLLAKLIVHAPDRASAIRRMRRALAELRIAGVETSVVFHQRVLAEPDFCAGRIDVEYVDRHPALLDDAADDEGAAALAALAAALLEDEQRAARHGGRIAAPTEHAAAASWRRRGWRA